MKEGGLGEAALLATTAQGLTDPTPMTGAELPGDGGLVAVAAVVVVAAKTTTVVIAIQARMTRVPRKATWVVTIITSPARHLGSTIRTATTMHQVPGSTLTLLADTIRVMAMKVRLRVQFEF